MTVVLAAARDAKVPALAPFTAVAVVAAPVTAPATTVAVTRARTRSWASRGGGGAARSTASRSETYGGSRSIGSFMFHLGAASRVELHRRTWRGPSGAGSR